MRLAERGELALLAAVRKRFQAASVREGVIAGIGDDAAVLGPSSGFTLVTTDMMNEGVHFDLAYTSPFQLGFKLVSVNVSDIYAMGGKPLHLFLGLALTSGADDLFFAEFYDGVAAAMDHYGVQLLGGDLCAARSDISVSATIIGSADRPVMRSGARPGHKIYVTGTPGDSAAGLALLRQLDETGRAAVRSIRNPMTVGPLADLFASGVRGDAGMHLILRHLMPVARDSEDIAPHASAMLDMSDGLFMDLCRLCDESATGAAVYLDRIPISSALRDAAPLLGLDALDLASSGGEDYELIFTAEEFPMDEYNATHQVGVRCVGEITEKSRTVIDSRGNSSPLAGKGYQHFRTK